MKVYDINSYIRTLDPNEIKDSNGNPQDNFGYYLHGYYGTILIEVDPNTPSGHRATINLEITDLYGNKFNDSFEVNVQ